MMSQLVRPLFGDLLVDGVVVLGWLFILALIGYAWWEKRQVRLIREWSRGQLSRPTSRTKSLRTFFKSFRGRFVLLATVSIAVAIILWGRENSSGANGAARNNPASPTDKTSLASAARSPLSSMVFTDLWDETGPATQTLNLAIDTNLFSDLDSAQETMATSEGHPASDAAGVSTNNKDSDVVASPLANQPGVNGGKTGNTAPW